MQDFYDELSNHQHSIFLINKWVELNHDGTTRTRVDVERVHTLPIIPDNSAKTRDTMDRVAQILFNWYSEIHGRGTVIWYSREQLIAGPPLSSIATGGSIGTLNLSINMSVNVRCFNPVLGEVDHDSRV